ncbi:MAG TPA: MCP four helix bundle domain-containing protein, partial [Burkholderiaceae bacterium]|nr:MCP four helix bundle domain-containing protein [Burkholderiaceae bacterium]
MDLSHMSVRAKLLAAFGLLLGVLLVVSVVSVLGLSHSHDDFARYVSEAAARNNLARDVQESADARAIAARNLVLVTAPADRDAEKAIVTVAHERLTKQLAALKLAVAKQNVSQEERRLLEEFESIESQYAPVALKIVELAVAGNKDEAITKMNADCRPLLARLVAVSNKY